MRIRSPGSSVIPCEMNAITSATPNTMFAVFESCITSPFRIARMPSDCGSGTSLAGTSSPTGRNVSSDLPRTHWPSANCRSRPGDVVRDDVAAHVGERVLDRDAARTLADHDAELGFVVDVLRDRRDPDCVAGGDQGVRPLGKEQRPLGQGDALLVRVIAVVEADADDFLGEFDHGLDTTTPSATSVAISASE